MDSGSADASSRVGDVTLANNNLQGGLELLGDLSCDSGHAGLFCEEQRNHADRGMGRLLTDASVEDVGVTVGGDVVGV